jgi:hypothetical protein
MSDFSKNLKILVIPHLNDDLKEFTDFCKVFEQGAISLTKITIERIKFD